jgi:UDP-N-acetylmuramoyl-tripeptide--D-alanyl-D-alanine ligase
MKDIFKKFLFYILQIESRLVLRKYKPRIIAITGSVGKTSTKDAVYAVLSSFFYVRKSEKSYNSEIGLPLTILGCPNAWNNIFLWIVNIWKGFLLIILPHKYPEWLVLEVGVGKKGDMKRTALWLATDIIIITAVPETPAHIEFFDSRKDLIEEKSGLIKTLKPSGLLVLNADDEAAMGMKEKTKNINFTFGFGKEASIVGSEVNISYDEHDVPRGIIFRADVEGHSLPVEIRNVFGQNHVYASLASLAVASLLKLNMINAVEALKNYDVPPGRMRLLSGINDSFIIDDTYNSSPFACETALRTLHEVRGVRKIAVLGDMLELGKHTMEAHENIGKIAKSNTDVLMVVGPRAQSIKSGAEKEGLAKSNIFEFNTSGEAGDFLQTFVKKGDVVLIKGSQGMRMERTVEKVIADIQNKNNLLVRQDKEWQKR